MTQANLARLLGTTQAAVSRLEDPDYGRLSVKTLIDLAKVFDVGLSVKFVSLVRLFKENRTVSRVDLEVAPFMEEMENVAFYERPTKYFQSLEMDTSQEKVWLSTDVSPSSFTEVFARPEASSKANVVVEVAL